jgi:AcrR family transcriptional regulator
MDLTESLPLEGIDFHDRLREVIRLLYHHCKENFAFHKILGESELIDRVTIGYYESVARFIRNTIRRESQFGTIRLLDPDAISYGLIGICYFNSLDWKDAEPGWSSEQVIDFIVELAFNGICGSVAWERSADLSADFLPDPVPLLRESEEPFTKGEKTRQLIFNAAEKIFSRSGINRANIAEITREAGVAQGTFYVHFNSKKDLVEGFVKYINHKLRQELQRYVSTTSDRRNAEQLGILVFFEFLRQHRRIYRVVPEYEMIGQELGLWYYKKIELGYIKGLKRGIDKGEIRNLPATFLSRSLMGLTHFIGLKWIVWANNSQAKVPDQVIKDILEFTFFGLKPTKR